MKINKKRLKKKGWSEKDIQHAEQLIHEAEKEKSSKRKLHEEILLWILLGLIALASFVGAWISQPLLLIVSASQGLLMVGIIGILVGVFAGRVVAELEELEQHHHAFMTISIPVVSLVSAFIISERVQQMIVASPAFTPVEHNPLALALVYIAATLIPYALILFMEKKDYATA